MSSTRNKESKPKPFLGKVSAFGGSLRKIVSPKKTKADTPYTDLLLFAKEACDIIAPFIKAVYTELQQANKAKITTTKPDTSFFTIGDGIVQELLTNYFLRSPAVKDAFGFIVGEEDASKVNIETVPYMVDSLQVPDDLVPLIAQAKTALLDLSPRIFEGSSRLKALKKKAYKKCSLFLDPIDGTKSFVRGNGEHCTTMIGVVVDKRVVGGLVYRPLTSPPTFALGCKHEGTRHQNLGDANTDLTTISVPKPDVPGMMTSIRGLSPFIEELLSELKYQSVRGGSVGNKVLCLLEKKGELYVQDEGTSRWDTCGPQGVIEAFGGEMYKLHGIIEKGIFDQYSYDATGKTNTDLDNVLSKEAKFHPVFNGYNTKNRALHGEFITEEHLEAIERFSNMCGFICVTEETKTKT